MKKNKFQIKREITHGKLIEAGFHLFCKNGYSKTSVDDIVALAGYTKGAFYVHFESKEQFFLDLIKYRKHSRADLLPKLFSLVEMNLTLEQIIQQLVHGIVQHVKKTPEWILVYVDFFNQVKHDQKAVDIYKAYHESWISEIQQFIHLLKEKEHLPDHVDSLEKAKMMYTYLDGSFLHYNFYKEAFNENTMTKVFLSLLQSK